MTELFGVQIPAINKHLKNIFEDGELVENSVISILETTANDGKKYKTQSDWLDWSDKLDWSKMEVKL